MSEMSAEKKKEIEKYIIKSYFGGGKNVKPYIGGVDLVGGSCDIPDLLVEVESFNGELISVRWNVKSESESVWKNEFMMVLSRERKIERNRCDSVDAMPYAWEAWEAWKSKIQGKPVFLKTNDEDLQKDKRIEELEREIKALRAEKEVMERHIQELESHNVSLAETNNDKKHIEFLMYSMIATHKPFQENTEITITGTSSRHEILFEPNPFDIPCDVVVVPKKDFEALQTENEQLKKKLHEYDPLPEFHEFLNKVYSTNDIENLEWTLNHVCGGRGSVNGWIAVSLFWKQKYEALSKLVGFVTVEELQDYLTNEANCDTLHEAISKLKDEVKHACNEWYGANSSNNSWKAAAECNSPKELIDKIKGFRDEIGIYSRALKDWKEGTGCPSPSAAKTMIECRTSWHHAYEDAKKKIDRLEAALRESNSTMTKELENNIDEWQKATGCDTPERAEERIKYYKSRLGNAIQAASCASKHLDNITF